MNKKHSFIRIHRGSALLLVCASLFLFSACAPKVRINMLQPAQYHEASLSKTVAVLPFTGPGGREFAAELESILTGIGIDDKAYFTLVDRASIDRILSEMQLGQSGLVDPDTAARIGGLIGAQGIYTGMVTQNHYDDNRYTERRQTCVRYEEKRDRNGKVYRGQCLSWRQYHVSCVKRVANFAVAPRLVDVATGRVLYSRNLTATQQSSGCEDTRPAENAILLLDQARQIVKAEFRRDIAPYYVTREIRLMDDTRGITSAEAKDRLKRGLEYADRGRLDGACELWGEARNMEANAHALLYNLGVCAESRGDWDAALSLYRQADRLLGKPDDDISMALGRMNEAIRNRARLREQLNGQ
ncbi:MAG: CsgG/HfaB family protein [Smithellaceae bacterium]